MAKCKSRKSKLDRFYVEVWEVHEGQITFTITDDKTDYRYCGQLYPCEDCNKKEVQ